MEVLRLSPLSQSRLDDIQPGAQHTVTAFGETQSIMSPVRICIRQLIQDSVDARFLAKGRRQPDALFLRLTLQVQPLHSRKSSDRYHLASHIKGIHNAVILNAILERGDEKLCLLLCCRVFMETTRQRLPLFSSDTR